MGCVIQTTADRDSLIQVDESLDQVLHVIEELDPKALRLTRGDKDVLVFVDRIIRVFEL